MLALALGLLGIVAQNVTLTTLTVTDDNLFSLQVVFLAKPGSTYQL